MTEQAFENPGASIKPVDGRQTFIFRCAVSLACLLLAAAGICWIAANWADASNLSKMVGAQFVLVALILSAWLFRPQVMTQKRSHRWSANHNFSASANLTGLAGVAVGGLLALIGQIYQTGADPWQLFLCWAVLLVPWLIAQRTVFIGLLFIAVLNTALGLYLDIHQGGVWLGWGSWASSAVLAALLNALLLVVWEVFCRVFNDPWRIGPRVLATVVAGWLIVAAFMGIDAGAGPIGLSLIGWLVLAVMYLAYTRLRIDLAIVSMAAAAAFILLVLPLLYWVESEAVLLLVVLVLLAAMAVGLRKLGMLLRTWAVKGEPWYISAFRLVSMGITAVLLMAFLLIVLDVELDFLWMPGLAVCLAGVLFFRFSGVEALRELGLTLMTAGLLLAGGSFFMLYEEGASIALYALLTLGLGLYVLAGNAAFRFVAAFFVLGMATVMTWPMQAEGGAFLDTEQALTGVSLPIYLRMWWFSVAGALALLWGQGELAGRRWRPLGWALVFLAQIVVWHAPAPALDMVLDIWRHDASVVIVWLACATLPCVALAALLWRRPVLPPLSRFGAPAVLAIAAVGWTGAPGVSLALLWLFMGYAVKHRSLMVFGVLALLAYLLRYYYLLDSTLLHKSFVLAVTGAWLLAWAWVFRRNVHSRQGLADTNVGAEPAVKTNANTDAIKPFTRRGAWTSAGLLAGLLLVLVVANASIYEREQIVSEGRRVVLQLAPTDPRSLMQGDYMSLHFEVADQVPAVLKQAHEPSRRAIEIQRAGLLVLRADPAGVHRLIAVLPSGVAEGDGVARADARIDGGGFEFEADDVLLVFRMRHGGVRVVTDAWFFPEGQADHFARAQYGELRVDNKGVGLLVNMLDDALKPLAQR